MAEAYFENRKIGFLEVCNFLKHMSYKFLFLSRQKKKNQPSVAIIGSLRDFKATNWPEIPENYYIKLVSFTARYRIPL